MSTKGLKVHEDTYRFIDETHEDEDEDDPISVVLGLIKERK